MNKALKATIITVVSLLLIMTLATLELNAKNKESGIVLTSKNTLSLRGPVDDASVSSLIKKLRTLDTDKEVGDPIYLVLYTPGGSIQAGIELIEAIKGMRRPVKTITIFAASMGFQIVQNLDERFVLRGGILMSHKAHGGAEGEFGPGNDSQLDKRLGVWKSRLLDMDLQTVTRTKGKQTLQSYQAAYENEMWLTGSESVYAGYADKMVSVRCDSSLDGTESVKVSGLFGIEIAVKFSKCPLQTTPEDVGVQIATNQGYMTAEEFSSKGGLLGIDCSVAFSRVVSNGPVLCAVNGSLTKEKIDQERKKIAHTYSIAGMRENIGYSW